MLEFKIDAISVSVLNTNLTISSPKQHMDSKRILWNPCFLNHSCKGRNTWVQVRCHFSISSNWYWNAGIILNSTWTTGEFCQIPVSFESFTQKEQILELQVRHHFSITTDNDHVKSSEQLEYLLKYRFFGSVRGENKTRHAYSFSFNCQLYRSIIKEWI